MVIFHRIFENKNTAGDFSAVFFIYIETMQIPQYFEIAVFKF